MKKTGIGIFDMIHRIIFPLIVVISVVVSGCKAPTTWSAESRSSDGKMIATAKTLDESGPGTNFVQTTVFLNWAANKNAPTMILAFSDGPSGPDGMKVWLNWLTPNHLEVDYKGKRNFDFQAIKFGPVDISLRDLLSPEDGKSSHQ